MSDYIYPVSASSANTEVTVCNVCTDPLSGITISSVVPPHPVWTDGQNKPIIQMNAIVLGGPNGLNS